MGLVRDRRMGAVPAAGGVMPRRRFSLHAAVTLALSAALIASPAASVGSHTSTPAAPTNIGAHTDATNNRIVFTFDGTISSPATEYFEYSIDGANWATTWSNRVYVNNPTHGQNYTVRVRALNSHTHGIDDNNDGLPDRIETHRSRSSHISFTAGFVPSTAPTLTSASGGRGSISLLFRAPPTPNATVTGFQYQMDSGDWTDMAGSSVNSRSRTISGLTNGSTHTFKVRVVNALGDAGPASNQRSATVGVYTPPPGLGE